LGLSQLSKQRDVMNEAWKQLSQWTNAGQLRPIVGHVLPLEQIRDAYRLLSDRKNFGKVVLEVATPAA
jgi:NADPH:quinone reductase-like Zn-dependent oxidoreductase